MLVRANNEQIRHRQWVIPTWFMCAVALVPAMASFGLIMRDRRWRSVLERSG